MVNVEYQIAFGRVAADQGNAEALRQTEKAVTKTFQPIFVQFGQSGTQ